MHDLPAVIELEETAAKKLSPGERWISFLRGYGPVGRIDGMYAETIRKTADFYEVQPLRFSHPAEPRLADALNPEQGILTNVVLTGTAGDGKTTLCNELWQKLSGGDTSRTSGRNRANYKALEVETPQGARTLHFIFEFSGFAPEQGQPWSDAKLDLLNRFAASINDPEPTEFFIVAANDGKLVQRWEGLPEGMPATRLAVMFEELLVTGQSALEGSRLLLLDLSRMPTREILDRALDHLLARPEWRCFVDEEEDPAFGPGSALFQNFRLQSSPGVRGKLVALAELCDCNGLHVSIREVLVLLANILLGHATSSNGVMTIGELRELAISERSYEATFFDNVFGANLPERRRENFAVFRYLNGFRIGQETTNVLDGLIVFGPDDPALSQDYDRLLQPDDLYGSNPEFAQLRRDYLEAEETRSNSEPFIKALVTERRRLFFRLPEDDPRFDPWQLTVFEAAGDFRSKVLAPLKAGSPVSHDTLSLIVQGLNRIWTGMLVGELDRLYLSTGLDFSTARLSDIFLHEIPVQTGFHGSGITVDFDGDLRLPVLRIAIDSQNISIFRLHLVRFEFLTRVARGALPSSFSKECYEDVIAFKTKVLSAFYSMPSSRRSLSILSTSTDGLLVTRQLGVSL